MKDTGRENIGDEQVVNKSNFSITALIDENSDRFRRLKIDTDGNLTVVRPDLIAKVTSTEIGQVFALKSDLYIGLREIKAIKKELVSKVQVVRHKKERNDFTFDSGTKSTRMFKVDNERSASCDRFKNQEEINRLLDSEQDQNTQGVISDRYNPFLLEKVLKVIKTFTGGSKNNLTTVKIIVKKNRMYYYAKNSVLNTELKIVVMAVQETNE